MIPKLADMVQKQSILCLSDLGDISTVDSCLVLIIHVITLPHTFSSVGGTVLSIS